MKIDQHPSILNNGPPVSGAASPKARAGAAVQEKPGADLARTSSSISLRPSSSGDFDAARVERLRQSVSAGSYQASAARIADGLLSTVRDVLGRKP